MADWAFVYTVRDGRAVPTASASAQPEMLARALETQERFPIEISGPSPVADCIRSGRPLLIRRASPQDLRKAARGAEHLKMLEEARLASALFVPLLVRGEARGALAFVRNAEAPAYEETDLAAAEQVARRASLAMERNDLYTSLAGAQRQLEGILRSITDGVTAQDASGRMVYANDAAARLIGFKDVAELVAASTDEVLGRFDMFDEAGRPLDVARLPSRAALQGTPVRDMVIRYRIRATGSEHVSLVSATPVLDEAGRVVLAVNTFRDVTRQRLLERDQSLLASIVDSSEDAIVSKDTMGIVTSWNRGAERIFGYSAQEMIGRSITTIIPANLLDEEDRILRRIRAGEKVDHFETLRRRKDGTLVNLSVTVSPLRNAAGQVIGASKIGRDISEAIRHRQELAHLNLELENRVHQRTAALENAVRELESFNYAVSHDLRTPLRAISGFANVALKEAHPGSTLARYVGFILDASEEMGRIIEALLRLSRLSQSGVQRVGIDLAPVVRESLSKLAANDAGRQVRSEVPNTMPARADPVMIRSVLENLLSNAWKFTRPVPEPRIEVGIEHAQGKVWYFVRDNGVGFTAKEAEQLFQPFRRMRPDEFEGTGVGLATAKKVVEAHGGEIRAEGRPGEGATFRFTLPG